MKKNFITGFISGAVAFTMVGAMAANMVTTPNVYPVKLDGKDVSIEGYNVDDYTYFKLRDISDAVGGFDVDFKDDTIVLTSEKSDNNALAIKEEGMFSSGGTPEIGSEQYKKFLDAKIPMIIYFGDYIDNGPDDIQSTTFWKNVRDGAVTFAEQYNKDGGNCTVINLPDIGMNGNSHFMFQEKNSEEIAQHVENWIKENVK